LTETLDTREDAALILNSIEKFVKYISSMGLEVYKTLATALQILMTLPVSVASCERSFSKMKLIKSYLQSTMSQDRFTNFAVISIEIEVASSIDFSDVIKDFAAIKVEESSALIF
jgi:soluble P-type ATPase